MRPKCKTLSPREMQRAREAISADGRLDIFASECGFTSEEEALCAVGEALGFRFVDLTSVEVDTSLLEAFPYRLIHRHRVFPLRLEEGSLVVATGNPFDLAAIDSVSAATDRSVIPAVVLNSELDKLIKAHLGVGAETVDGLIAQHEERQGGVEILDDLEWDDSSEDAEQAQQASVVRLVNEILCEAIEARTSDIHLESQPSGMKIRYRVDGVLQKQPTPPEINRFQAAIVSRLKIMAKMNIAEKRVPQDGRIKLKVRGREIDIRISIIPMLNGEGVVMRILDKEAMSFSLRDIGLEADTYARFRQLIELPHGILLVTGPTGSGKTTTLYSCLVEIHSEETKIITTEDPIEYQLEGINQIQVHPKIGVTFASSLRSILRHDPDVVLVGEIRDLETAINAVQASLTGHLVFSTLHTNDASGAFLRLMDMGVEPFLVSSTVEGVMAQRLVRTLCPECSEPYTPSVNDLPQDFPIDDFAYSDVPLYRKTGCRHCRGTGYKGRVGIFEQLIPDEKIRQLASEGKSSTIIQKAAISGGMRTLRQDGWRKVTQGRTTIDEVLRVTKAE